MGENKINNSTIFKFNEEGYAWKGLRSMPSRKFACFNCNSIVASENGYANESFGNELGSTIYICPHCKAPNVWDDNFSSASLHIYGESIEKLPENVNFVYSEARKCMTVFAYTATAMLLRKLLMNFSVEKGAKEGDSFSNYVSFLCQEGYVHRSNRKRAERIKQLGNNANHKIEAISAESAKDMFGFVSLFLKYNYEQADEE